MVRIVRFETRWYTVTNLGAGASHGRAEMSAVLSVLPTRALKNPSTLSRGLCSFIFFHETNTSRFRLLRVGYTGVGAPRVEPRAVDHRRLISVELSSTGKSKRKKETLKISKTERAKEIVEDPHACEKPRGPLLTRTRQNVRDISYTNCAVCIYTYVYTIYIYI